jgi:DNA-directed RNA polymerase subunit RPC12/RpoP
MGRLNGMLLSAIILSSIIAGSLMLSHPATADITISDFTFEFRDGGTTVAITDYNGSGGEVVIPDMIDGKPVTVIDNWTFGNCSSLTSVKIPENVTYIGHFAFLGCKSLQNISIPANVTNIGMLSFGDCTSLTTFFIPAITNVHPQAFDGCTSLTSINVDIANPYSASVDGVWYSRDYYSGAITGLLCFPSSSKITNLTIPSSTWLIPNSSFVNCASLVSITFPYGLKHLDPNSIINCSSLIKIIFKGNAPSDLQTGYPFIDDYNSNLTIYYYYNSTGFTSPTWQGLPVSQITLPPDAPTNLVAIAGNESVTLSWYIPDSSGGSEIDYYVIYQDNIDVKHVDSTTVVINNLNNGQNYRFEVFAHNANGLGTASNQVLSTPISPSPTEIPSEDNGFNLFWLIILPLVLIPLIVLFFIYRNKKEKLPPVSKYANCSKCKNKFLIKDLDPNNLCTSCSQQIEKERKEKELRDSFLINSQINKFYNDYFNETGATLTNGNLEYYSYIIGLESQGEFIAAHYKFQSFRKSLPYPNSATLINEEKRLLLKKVDILLLSGRFEEAALQYESIGMWKEAGDARNRYRTFKNINVNVNVNQLIDTLKNGGLGVQYKCMNCGASLSFNGNTTGEKFMTCPYCGTMIDTQLLKNIIDDALKN